MCQWISSAVVPIKAGCLFGTNGNLGTNFSEILIKIQNFSFTKMHLKILSAKWQPFCPGGDELTKGMSYFALMDALTSVYVSIYEKNGRGWHNSATCHTCSNNQVACTTFTHLCIDHFDGSLVVNYGIYNTTVLEIPQFTTTTSIICIHQKSFTVSSEQ